MYVVSKLQEITKVPAGGFGKDIKVIFIKKQVILRDLKKLPTVYPDWVLKLIQTELKNVNGPVTQLPFLLPNNLSGDDILDWQLQCAVDEIKYIRTGVFENDDAVVVMAAWIDMEAIDSTDKEWFEFFEL